MVFVFNLAALHFLSGFIHSRSESYSIQQNYGSGKKFHALRKLATIFQGSSHPAHAKMEPYSDLPKSLVLEASYQILLIQNLGPVLFCGGLAGPRKVPIWCLGGPRSLLHAVETACKACHPHLQQLTCSLSKMDFDLSV